MFSKKKKCFFLETVLIVFWKFQMLNNVSFWQNYTVLKMELHTYIIMCYNSNKVIIWLLTSAKWFYFFPPLLTLSHSSSSPRLTHDISLDEFEDDDLSEITEITDERGRSLNCNGPDIRVSCPQWGSPSTSMCCHFSWKMLFLILEHVLRFIMLLYLKRLYVLKKNILVINSSAHFWAKGHSRWDNLLFANHC